MSTVMTADDRLFQLFVANLRTDHPIPALALARQQLNTYEEQTKEDKKK